jgi:O-antigen/teichoic acid export membrane protein
MQPNKPPKLRQRVMRAASWTLGGHAISQVIRLGSNLIMTRLLAPEMFGVMAIAFVFIMALGMFSDVGLRQVIIKSHRGDDRRFLNTVWTVQILRGLAICTFSLCIAAVLHLCARAGLFPAGGTYAHPALPFVLAALSITAVIGGFESTKLISQNRRLAMGRITVIEVASQVLAMVPMIIWALLAPSIYALVAGAVTSSLLRVALGHFLLRGANNRFAWDRSSLTEIFGFGHWVFLSSVLGFLVNTGDRIVLGWFLSAEALGLYSIAVIMAGVAKNVANKLITSVALPALGEIQRNQPERIRAIYYRIRLPIDALCLVVGSVLVVAGGELVRVLYDVRYADAGWMLQVLAVSMFVSRYGVIGQFYFVLGKPKLVAHLAATRLVSLSMMIPAGYYLAGLHGAVWGVALSGLPDVIATLLITKRRLKLLDTRKELLVLLFIPVGLALGYGLSMALSVVGSR